MSDQPLADSEQSASWGSVVRSVVCLVALVAMIVLWAERQDHAALFAGWVCLAQVGAEVFSR